MTNPWPNAAYASQREENATPPITRAELAKAFRKYGFWMIGSGLVLSSFVIPSLPSDVKHLVDDAARQYETVYHLGRQLRDFKFGLFVLGSGFQLFGILGLNIDTVQAHLRHAFPMAQSKVMLSIYAALAALALLMQLIDIQGLSSTFDVTARTVVFVKFAAAFYIFAFAAAIASLCFRESRRVSA